MPSTPSTPATPHRRRSAGIRRPRVAGLTAPTRPVPSGHEDVLPEDAPHENAGNGGSGQDAAHEDVLQGEAPSGRVGLLKRPVLEPETAEDETAEQAQADPSDTGDDISRPTGKRRLGARIRRPRASARTRRPVPTLVLVGLLVVLTAAAVFFGIADASLQSTPAAQNSALVDVGTTAQVTQQLGDAVKTVYSYDFARLDQNEAAARAVILPGFEAQYNQLFGQVRKIAPQQQAVVTATIATSAVREIDGDRAVVVIFLDQQVTRAQAGNQPQQLAAAGRLTVTGQLVDGTWKIADVQAD